MIPGLTISETFEDTSFRTEKAKRRQPKRRGDRRVGSFVQIGILPSPASFVLKVAVPILDEPIAFAVAIDDNAKQSGFITMEFRNRDATAFWAHFPFKLHRFDDVRHLLDSIDLIAVHQLGIALDL